MRKIDLDLNTCLNIFYDCRCNLMIIDYTYFMITFVILWVLFYICQDFLAIYEHQWLQKLIVFIVVEGAIFGALLGIWLNNILGRKWSMIFSNYFLLHECFAISLLWKNANWGGPEDNNNYLPCLHCRGLIPPWSRCANHNVFISKKRQK